MRALTAKVLAVRQAITAYRAADAALQANSQAEMAAGITWETCEFHRLNDASWAARDTLASELPHWLRRLVS